MGGLAVYILVSRAPISKLTSETQVKEAPTWDTPLPGGISSSSSFNPRERPSWGPYAVCPAMAPSPPGKKGRGKGGPQPMGRRPGGMAGRAPQPLRNNNTAVLTSPRGGQTASCPPHLARRGRRERGRNHPRSQHLGPRHYRYWENRGVCL